MHVTTFKMFYSLTTSFIDVSLLSLHFTNHALQEKLHREFGGILVSENTVEGMNSFIYSLHLL